MKQDIISTSDSLQRIYRRRFEDTAAYRNSVWQVLAAHFFSRWVRPIDAVLDLGCGYGEFINNIEATSKVAIDLNPDAARFLASDIGFYLQDSTDPWPVKEESLDVVFTSNFFEHLPDKVALTRTLERARQALKSSGRIIALGPNIKYLRGRYWDFFDHHTPLTESSLAEALILLGFDIEYVVPRFLPYTLVNAPKYPIWMLKLYLMVPFLWWVAGRQFLVVARKPK